MLQHLSIQRFKLFLLMHYIFINHRLLYDPHLVFSDLIAHTPEAAFVAIFFSSGLPETYLLITIHTEAGLLLAGPHPSQK